MYPGDNLYYHLMNKFKDSLTVVATDFVLFLLGRSDKAVSFYLVTIGDPYLLNYIESLVN